MKLKDLLKEGIFPENPELEQLYEEFKNLSEEYKDTVFLKVLVHAKNTQKITIQDLEKYIKGPKVGLPWGTRKGETPSPSGGHPQRKQ